MNHEALIIGAGAAGLAAAIDLARAGFCVRILEARNRLGGRMFTTHDPELGVPIELGAEFIHGRPPEILQRLPDAKISEVDGDHWCVKDGKIGGCDFFSEVDAVLGKMGDRHPDESFASFLERCFPASERDPKLQEAINRATAYVSGFNAADPKLVGVHWLVQSSRAEEKIEGDRAFRPQHGYADLLNYFEEQLRANAVRVQAETIVEQIRWREGIAEIKASARGEPITLSAPTVLITIPLALLQAQPDQNGAIEFLPELPQEKRNALATFEMGKVIRVTLRFKQRFWQNVTSAEGKKLSDTSFLFSDDDWFPTWWTPMPDKSPIITGWAPFRCAEKLSGKSHDFVVEQSVKTLARLLHFPLPELEALLSAGHTHDWQSDPFSRGAYSYGKVGCTKLQKLLGDPLANTLFFAGEATDTTGHNGTVHGAIASGIRAAREIMEATDPQ